ncbi:MAG: lipase secretion chaperone, partial [Pseudomonadota bacterium]
MKKSILVSSFFLVVIVCFLWLVFKPIDKKTNNQEDLKPDQATTLNIGSIKPSNGFIPIAVDAFGGNIYCELSFDTNQTFVLDNMTKDCFDKLLKNNPTESDPTNFGLNFFNKLLVDPAQSIVKDLWIRYVKYTDQVILTHKAHSKNQANYINAKKLVDAIRSIRARFFTPFEIKALFGASDKIEDYELVVLKINESTGMTDDEIEQELNAAINNLPEKSRKAIKFNKDFNDVSRKVQEIKNRGGSQEEIRKERLKVF